MPNEEKLFYTIGEASQIVSVKPYVLRYWESEFKKLNPQKSETGQRTYRKKDLEIALTIKRLLYEEKYTIAGAMQRLEEIEKEGFDQLDIFGTKTPPPKPAESQKSIAGNVPHLSEALAVELPPAKPGPPKEKVAELEKLMEATTAILKKYNLA
jgi:DNA-binding transcriptional MerR regulator